MISCAFPREKFNQAYYKTSLMTNIGRDFFKKSGKGIKKSLPYGHCAAFLQTWTGRFLKWSRDCNILAPQNPTQKITLKNPTNIFLKCTVLKKISTNEKEAERGRGRKGRFTFCEREEVSPFPQESWAIVLRWLLTSFLEIQHSVPGTGETCSGSRGAAASQAVF